MICDTDRVARHGRSLTNPPSVVEVTRTARSLPDFHSSSFCYVIPRLVPGGSSIFICREGHLEMNRKDGEKRRLAVHRGLVTLAIALAALVSMGIMAAGAKAAPTGTSLSGEAGNNRSNGSQPAVGNTTSPLSAAPTGPTPKPTVCVGPPTWRNEPPLNTSRAYAPGVVVSNSLYVLTGYDGIGYVTSAEMYNGTAW